jgi:hypothetical protein
VETAPKATIVRCFLILQLPMSENKREDKDHAKNQTVFK